MSETFVEEFFMAPRVPANTHEEWLLRLCAQLLHREAHVVSVMEQAQQQSAAQALAPSRRRGRGGSRTRRRVSSEEEEAETAVRDHDSLS